MPETSRTPNTSSRRLFFGTANDPRQIFSFDQHSDGSIYISSPTFDKTRWITVNPNPPPALELIDAPNSEKISVHSSGVVHVKTTAITPLRIKGSYLLKAPDDGGVRHLLSCAISEPNHLPKSPAQNRVSDVVITAQHLRPYVFIFWAVPAAGDLRIGVGGSFHVDDFPVPPDMGFGAFQLRTHHVVWLTYRTNNMDEWPSRTYAAFHDGYHVPLMIGMADKMQRMELRRPKYTLVGNELDIQI